MSSSHPESSSAKAALPDPFAIRPLPAHHPSPLDDVMSRLLALLRQSPTGGRITHTQEFATLLEVHREFVEALFTSAQRRGLIKPLSAVKGKITWSITPLGDRLLEYNAQEIHITYGADD